MGYTLKDKKITLTEEEIREIVEASKEKKGFIEIETRYWSLDCYSVNSFIWVDGTIGNKKLARGNVYLTEEEAQRADSKRLVLGTIQAFIRDNNLEFKPDWGNENETKYTIAGWNYNNDAPNIDYYYQLNISSYNLIFKSAEDMQLVLDECRKELKILLK